jgi:hypothetical protein
MGLIPLIDIMLGIDAYPLTLSSRGQHPASCLVH